MQGLATSLIDHSYHARLFTSVAVVEIVAKLVGGPVMGKLFSISRRHEQGSKGLCFSVSAVSRQRSPKCETAADRKTVNADRSDDNCVFAKS